VGTWHSKLNAPRETLGARVGLDPRSHHQEHPQTQSYSRCYTRGRGSCTGPLFVFQPPLLVAHSSLRHPSLPLISNTIQSRCNPDPGPYANKRRCPPYSPRWARATGTAAAAPISPRVQDTIREVPQVCAAGRVQCQIRKPLPSFLKQLYVEFDFEGRPAFSLQLAERVVGNDYFLSEIQEEFLDMTKCGTSSARLTCRIHQRIDIAYIVFPLRAR